MAKIVIDFKVVGATIKEIEDKAVEELTKFLGYIPKRQEIYYEVYGWSVNQNNDIVVWKADVQYAV